MSGVGHTTMVREQRVRCTCEQAGHEGRGSVSYEGRASCTVGGAGARQSGQAGCRAAWVDANCAAERRVSTVVVSVSMLLGAEAEIVNDPFVFAFDEILLWRTHGLRSGDAADARSAAAALCAAAAELSRDRERDAAPASL